MSKVSKFIKGTLLAGAALGFAAYLARKKSEEETDAQPATNEEPIQREYVSLKKKVETSFGEVSDADFKTADEAASKLSKDLTDSGEVLDSLKNNEASESEQSPSSDSE